MDFFGIFLLSIIFSILIGYWASKWERSVAIYVIISLIITPVLAALILLLAGDNRYECPHCAEKINREAKVCKHCRKNIDVVLL